MGCILTLGVGGIMELHYFMFTLSDKLLRCNHQLRFNQDAPILNLCLVLTWTHPFSTLVADDVSFFINYSFIECSPVYYGIKLVEELD